MNHHEMKVRKFATQIDEKVLEDLKSYAKAQDRSITSIVSEAVAEYIQKARIRPAFRKAMNEVIAENSELLSKLAK